MNRRRRWLGLLFSLLSMLTYGMVPVLGHLWSATMDPLLFGGLASLAGSLPLILSLRVSKKHKDILAPKFFPYYLGVGFFNTIATLLFFLGTGRTSGLNTGLLLQLEPFYSIVIAAIFLKEVLQPSQTGAIVLMVAGAGLIVYHGASALNAGDLLILAVPLFQQLSHVVTKQIIHKVSDATVIPAMRLFLSGLCVTSIALILHPDAAAALASPAAWVAILVFGFAFRGLDCYFWYQAIERIPLVRASALIPVSAAISFAGSIFILGETAQPRHYKGVLLILAGLCWLSWLQLNEKEKEPLLEGEPL